MVKPMYRAKPRLSPFRVISPYQWQCEALGLHAFAVTPAGAYRAWTEMRDSIDADELAGREELSA